MQLLLDTHAFLWWIFNDSKLSKTANSLIADNKNQCYVSHASAWELAIKVGQGKLALGAPVGKLFSTFTASNNFKMLDLNLNYLLAVEHLPLHHKDPFDRLLVAQAQAEKLAIVSADTALDAYDIERIW